MKRIITPNTAQLRMLASIKSQQWMIRPEAVQDFAFSALEVAEKSNGEQKADSYWSQFYTLRKAAYIDGNGIAHIEVRGALMNKAPSIYEMLGLATRYSTIIEESKAAKDQGAKGILYYMDSPGGTVAGVIEGGQAITDLGLPTVAFCSGLACSACYWLASGATAILATPSATVGNVGAIISWADCDKFWEDLGVTFKALVSEGADLKSTFHLEPDEKQLEFLQESINEAGAAFREHVATGRAAAGATLDEEIYRAGWYSGEKAYALGLIDGIGAKEDAVSLLLDIS
jgi:ClpP class serine protease